MERTSSFYKLPTEIVTYIIKLAVVTSDRYAPIHLAAFALVHPFWAGVVEEELLKHVWIKPRGPHEGLIRLLDKRAREGKAGLLDVECFSKGRQHEMWDIDGIGIEWSQSGG